MRIFYILFFISFSLTGQQVTFKGKLSDKVTKAPVVYANISFLDSEKGISTTASGSFEMYIPEKMLNSKVHISCLNYQDTIVYAKDIFKRTLYLTPVTIRLNEVVISKKVDRKLIVDPVKKKVLKMHSKGLRMWAKYFPYDEKYKCCSYIAKIDIHFSRWQNKQSKFRFRIFSKDTVTGLPKDDLLTKSIPVTIKKDEVKVSLHIIDYDIEIPKNGFFVAFEKLFIPFNEYGRVKTDPDSEVFYSPVIGITKSREFKDIHRNFIFLKGKWVSFEKQNKGSFKGYVPAISVTLSN